MFIRKCKVIKVKVKQIKQVLKNFIKIMNNNNN